MSLFSYILAVLCMEHRSFWLLLGGGLISTPEAPPLIESPLVARYIDYFNLLIMPEACSQCNDIHVIYNILAL